MKRLTCMILLAIAMASSLALAQEERKGTWTENVYTNTLAGLTFTCPPEWLVHDEFYLMTEEDLEGSNATVDDLDGLNSGSPLWIAYDEIGGMSICLQVIVKQHYTTQPLEEHFGNYYELIRLGERFTATELETVAIGGYEYQAIYLSEKYDSRAEIIRDTETHRIMITIQSAAPFDYKAYLKLFT